MSEEEDVLKARKQLKDVYLLQNYIELYNGRLSVLEYYHNRRVVIENLGEG